MANLRKAVRRGACEGPYRKACRLRLQICRVLAAGLYPEDATGFTEAETASLREIIESLAHTIIEPDRGGDSGMPQP